MDSYLCVAEVKLEMIGDHLQLQPSIMQKFAFERTPTGNQSADLNVKPQYLKSMYLNKIKLISRLPHRASRQSVTSARNPLHICNLTASWRVNNVNISMFERLITAPNDHKAPSSVLSVQRRMRKDVCDLTREQLAKVVSEV